MSGIQIGVMGLFVFSWILGFGLQGVVVKQLRAKSSAEIQAIFGYDARSKLSELSFARSKAIFQLLFTRNDLRSHDFLLYKKCRWLRAMVLIQGILLLTLPIVMFMSNKAA